MRQATVCFLALFAVSCSRPTTGTGDTTNTSGESESELNGPRKDPYEQKVRVRLLSLPGGENLRFLKWGPNDTAGKVTGMPTVRVRCTDRAGKILDFILAWDDQTNDFVPLEYQGRDDWIEHEYQMEKEGLRGDRAQQRAKGWPREETSRDPPPPERPLERDPPAPRQR